MRFRSLPYVLSSLGVLLSLTAPAALAQPAPPQGAHAGMAMNGGMMDSMDRMQRAMAAVPMTGDADRDFAAMMIPHHQGAIDMAQYELDHGRDPAMRRLATEIVAAQKKEIALMQRWLQRHPAR